MAIRDAFRRALHKSSSSDSMSQSDSSKTASSSTRNSSSSETSSSPMSLIKTFSSSSSSSFRLTKTFTFGSRDKSKEKESNKDSTELPKSKAGRLLRSRRNTKTYSHPSQRPLTEQNIRHQEMLSHFTMTFGTSNLSQIQDFDDDGISPCCTRVCSVVGEPL